jgi:hypothetical protein
MSKTRLLRPVIARLVAAKSLDNHAGKHNIESALGFYGLARSVYSNIVARGREVTFEKNTAMAIRFGAPPRKR